MHRSHRAKPDSLCHIHVLKECVGTDWGKNRPTCMTERIQGIPTCVHEHVCVYWKGNSHAWNIPVCKTLVHIPWDAPWDFSDSGILNKLQIYRCGCVLEGEFPGNIPGILPGVPAQLFTYGYRKYTVHLRTKVSKQLKSPYSRELLTE